MVAKLVTSISDRELMVNFIRQDFYRDKFVLALISGNTAEYSSKSILLFDDLKTLKDSAKEIKNVNDNMSYVAYAYGIEIGSDSWMDENISEEMLKLNKAPVWIDIQRTATKIPVIGVGGGAMANLFSCRYVLTPKKTLKRALFIRHAGDLCNSKNQALVPVMCNDLIVDVSGMKPFDLNNPDITIKLYRVATIHEMKLECEDVSEKLDGSCIIQKVVEGAHTYHNRDGSYFCSELKVKNKKEGVPEQDEDTQQE
jgi:hypothetical protein